MTETLNKNTGKPEHCEKGAACGLCAVLCVVLRPVVWLGKGVLAVLAAVSHVRDFFVFVAQASSLPVRMAVYCVMSAVIVFFFWTVLNNPRLKARGFLTRCRLSRNRRSF